LALAQKFAFFKSPHFSFSFTDIQAIKLLYNCRTNIFLALGPLLQQNEEVTTFRCDILDFMKFGAM